GGSEFFYEFAKHRRINLRLVFEDVVAEIKTQLLGLGIEVMSKDGRLVRPVVHGQRKVVDHQRNFVSLHRLLDERRGVGALRALQILKFDDRDMRSRGRLENGARVLSNGKSRKQQCGEAIQRQFFDHRKLDAAVAKLKQSILKQSKINAPEFAGHESNCLLQIKIKSPQPGRGVWPEFRCIHSPTTLPPESRRGCARRGRWCVALSW